MEFVPALRSTLDENKPSLFDVLSEQQLNNLPPALRYILTVATQRNPHYLLRILNSFDEIYAVLMLLVERHFLRTRSGSFMENFYGLKREKALAFEVPRVTLETPSIVRDTLKLTDADVWKNLLVLVGVPYLKRKLDESYEVDAPRALLGAAYTRLPDRPTLRDRLLHCYRWCLRRLYPSVNAAYYLANLFFSLAYLFDRSKYHSPLMWLIGTRLRTMTAANYRAIEETLSRKSKAGSSPGPRSIFAPARLGSAALSSLSWLLPTSIFVLKFLEWWYQSDFAQQLSKEATRHVDLPPPVISITDLALERPTSTSEKITEEGEEASKQYPASEDAPIASTSMLPIYVVPTPKDSTACPICLDLIITPTACQTGVVYCYTCIHKWIEGVHDLQVRFLEGKVGKWESGKGRCAVTGKRVLGGTEGLRRIMV